jgi:crotonobetainyl-CoA:carnitine CoA-transferase CaiB-like acyl-CoA transferase
MTSSMLADFGADVIHVESPETGDFMREVTGAAGQARASRGYDIINRNKRNISLDRRAYGMIGEAFSGWAHMNGYVDGPSIHSSFSLGDTMDSIWAANAIVMALYWRDAQGGGEGQLIDQGLVEPLFRELEQQIIIYDQTGVSPRRDGTRHEATPYADVCQTKDGRYFSFSAFTQDAIGRLLAALGLESDSRFNEFQSCDEHEEEFHQVAADWFKARTLAQAVEAFENAGAIGAPVMSGEDMCEDPHIKAREMLVSMPDPEGGETPIVMQGIVPKLSETPGKMRNASEPMGARNEEVFCGLLGLSKDDLAALAAAGVV